MRKTFSRRLALVHVKCANVVRYKKATKNFTTGSYFLHGLLFLFQQKSISFAKVLNQIALQIVNLFKPTYFKFKLTLCIL